MNVKWNELSARERDALVAEFVMEHEKVIGHESIHGGWVRRASGKPFINMEKCPTYTTDISVAWEVIEKMRSHYQITISTVERPTDKYACGLRYRMDDETEYTYAPTFPEAICIAALHACGVEVEQ